jgi:hypothetical protein
MANVVKPAQILLSSNIRNNEFELVNCIFGVARALDEMECPGLFWVLHCENDGIGLIGAIELCEEVRQSVLSRTISGSGPCMNAQVDVVGWTLNLKEGIYLHSQSDHKFPLDAYVEVAKQVGRLLNIGQYTE